MKTIPTSEQAKSMKIDGEKIVDTSSYFKSDLAWKPLPSSFKDGLGK